MHSPHPGSSASLKNSFIKTKHAPTILPLREFQQSATPCQESGKRTKYISYYLSQVANNILLNNLGENPRFTISLLGLGQETEHQGTENES